MPEILRPIPVAVLKTDGINCDGETKYAFEKAGARAEIIHFNQFRSKEKRFKDFQIIVLPGGFSYGDDIASGRVMAVELQTQFANALLEHSGKGKLIVGICNGFQVLVQTNLLPFGQLTTLNKTKTSLSPNDSEIFESRWIKIAPQAGVFPFVLPEGPLSLPVAHGEGKFITDKDTLKRLEENGQVVFRYCQADGSAAIDYPENPNGSINAIAGICDPSGRIIGLMPHPERNTESYHQPNFRRGLSGEADGLRFIKKVVEVAGEL